MHSNRIGLHFQRSAPGLAVLYTSHTVVLDGSLFEKMAKPFHSNRMERDPTSVGFDGAQAARRAPMAGPAAPCPCAPSVPLCSADCSRRSARTALTQRVFIRFVPAFHDRYLRNEGFRFQLGNVGAQINIFGAISIGT